MVYADVIGQTSNVEVLTNIIKKKAGFHQSYVFAGPHGTGKTTLGRILARALLCDAPLEGNPCDKCPSCLTILDHGNSECFIEIDAATNSGKSDIKEIVDSLEYTVVSGKKRIYLFDEAHELSRQALDGLLKPMEDTVYGTQEKKLICIFCTTEPEKMRKTIFSRCAPAFVVRSPSPQVIADRLSFICEQESIPFEYPALISIAEYGECHVRDAIKAVEGVSMVGGITQEAVNHYLRLDMTFKALDILEHLHGDFSKVLELLDTLSTMASASAMYELLAKLAMTAFRYSMGFHKLPSYLNEDRVKIIAEKNSVLLQLVKSLLSPPFNPTYNMLVCDLANYYHNQSTITPTQKNTTNPNQVEPSTVSYTEETTKVVNGVYREPKAINNKPKEDSPQEGLSLDQFRSFVLTRIKELEPNGR
tara:strand:- start:271 stop:1527 length:1257 start_codon:yes stop_codon:yes gene_type:complete